MDRYVYIEEASICEVREEEVSVCEVRGEEVSVCEVRGEEVSVCEVRGEEVPLHCSSHRSIHNTKNSSICAQRIYALHS
jgi:hypothetical protein